MARVQGARNRWARRRAARQNAYWRPLVVVPEDAPKTDPRAAARALIEGHRHAS